MNELLSEDYDERLLELLNFYDDGCVKSRIINKDNNGFFVIALKQNQLSWSLDNYNVELFMSYCILISLSNRNKFAIDFSEISFIGENFFNSCIVKLGGVLKRKGGDLIIGFINKKAIENMSIWFPADIMHLSSNLEEDIKLGKSLFRLIGRLEDSNANNEYNKISISDWYTRYIKIIPYRTIPWGKNVQEEVQGILRNTYNNDY